MLSTSSIHYRYSRFMCLLTFICCQVVVRADDDAERKKRAISIVIRECVSCHGQDKQEAGLRLDSLEDMNSSGEFEAIRSNVLERIEHTNEALVMPPKRRLDPTDIETMKQWIHAGMIWPASEEPQSTSEVLGDAWVDTANPIRLLFGGKRLDLWSLQPIRRPVIPAVSHAQRCRNEIDHFVLADWERSGLSPATDASDRTYLQRVSMDTIGLPADFSQIEEFSFDSRQSKYEEIVDQKLSSPSFGIHWARMWLDVVRYSDSNGFDWDELRPNAWLYRDYVVRSLNQDKPFDQFVLEQLAGDELVDGMPRTREEQDSLIATGYLRLGPRDNAAGLFNEQDRARAELMSDLTETTASAFLGLTMSCCRCHDHKTDPLSQEDHYRLRAFFASSQYSDDLSIDLREEQETIHAHNDAIDSKIDSLQRSMEELVRSVIARQTSTVEAEKVRELMSAEERDQTAQWEAEIDSLQKTRRPLNKGMLMQDDADNVPPTHILLAGDHRTPKAIVQPGFPSVLFPNTPSLQKPPKVQSSGRRSTLARWITSKDNPWTARVIVNRIWQNYFGHGIIATPNDFGLSGARPTHPELLDYLAIELIDSGWSLKHIHRLILTSRVYRQQSVGDTNDADKNQFATIRTQLRRKSAEQLRDSILLVSGLLKDRAGGPPIWPELDESTLNANPAVLDDNETKTKGWYPSPESDQSVRSLYLIQKRTIRIPWMETFDLPENSVSCGRRESSLVAPQSLSMMNGKLSFQASELLAKTILQDCGSNPRQQIETAFRTVLARRPVEPEFDSCELFLNQRTLQELCLVLLNTNEFAFID